MRTIIVANAKGGCGKTTIATGLASYYATFRNKNVVLADLDPQRSSLDWLSDRPKDRAVITPHRPDQGPVRKSPNIDVVIYDAPARSHGVELSHLVRRGETLLIPVLPSPLDMRAARNFLEELYALKTVRDGHIAVGIVANRVREHTRIYQDLAFALGRIKIPFVGALRDSMNYITAARRGLGILELAPSAVERDWQQWRKMLRWLNSKRALGR